ncbi:MAG: membrane protein insertase YidC [Treponema sp.]|nr:membrane protein insertase YidC [Treponema sp.]MBD5411567.1 membrane protein insertase YidC [Treponema sp.]MBD5443901.1 membrane protein insertase YidC [Treponema sp.]
MNKNTIIAMLLSTIVLIGAFIIQPILFPNAYTAERKENSVIPQDEQFDTEDIENTQKKISILSDIEENDKLEEKKIVLNFEKIEVELTNRGGDIISFKLNDHIDVDTGEGVQMVDNVSEFNRACALSFGDVYSPIINDLFTVEQKDENTVLFTKKFRVKNDDESESSFILGKRYTFMPGEFMFKLDVLIHGENEENKIDIANTGYNLRTSPQIGPHYDPKLNRYENRQFISFNGSKAKRQIISSRQFKEYQKPYMWNGIAGKYFVELVIPENKMVMNNSYYSSQVEVNEYANAQAIMVRKPINEQDVQDTYYMYFGPRNEKDLKVYNLADKNGWGLNGLRLSECLQSSGWLGWLETILKWIMEIVNRFVHNWGISIILMTIIIKTIMFPFTKKQSMGTLKMQEIQPKIKAIQEKYKDNPQKLNEAMTKVYQESGYNPMSGCLPMIVQFLILFAMYNLFNNYFEFRGSVFIPGWISDLSVGDSVYTFRRSIPFFGNQLRILPLIYLASQLFYGKITGNGGTASAGSSQMQMKMMMYGMPIVFFFIFYNAPSGLLLYWTVSNIFQMGQQIVINNMMKKKRAETRLEDKKRKR